PLWLGGLLFGLVSSSLQRARPLAWLFITVAAILAASGSARPHYLAPAFPVLFASGGVFAQRLGRRWHWLPTAAVVAVVIGFVVSAPLAIPLLTPAATVRYQDALGLRPREELERGGLLPMHLGLYLHPDAMLGPLLAAYRELPPEQQAR